jgi:hypothetical protein
VIFLILVLVIVALFAVARPMQTLIGAGVVALGIPVSRFVVRAERTTILAEHMETPNPGA